MLGVNDGRTLGAGSECMKALNFVRFCQFLFLRLGHFAVPATLYGSVALLISSPASAITFPNLYSLGLWHVVSETGQPQSVVSILCFHKISTDFYKCAWVCMCLELMGGQDVPGKATVKAGEWQVGRPVWRLVHTSRWEMAWTRIKTVQRSRLIKAVF